MPRDDTVRRYRRNHRDETDGAALYRAMADAEDSAELAEVYRRLGDIEQRHADFWAERLRRSGARVPSARPSPRARLLAWLARRFGANVVVPIVERTEHFGRTGYDDQPETAATSMRRDERSHAFLLSQIHGGVPGPALAKFEGRHRTPGGNAIRASVLGASDGLLSNLSLISGVAGAGVASGTVLLTGLAGLLAGAFSMALGEWVSVRSSREMTERQLAIEADEIASFPDEEQEELRLIYMARGLPEDEATAVAKRIMEDPDNALDVMAREELGIDPAERGGSPLIAALSSFLLFALGAAIPVLPFLWLATTPGIIASAAAGAVGLFALGAAITLFTGRDPVWGGLRQTLLGLAAAAVTFGVGQLLGVAVA